MNFYFLRKPSTHGQVPFSTTDRHMGAKIVDCPVCGTRGMIGKNKLGRVPVEIVIRDIVDELDDIEQAGTVLLGSRKFREAVAAGGLTGIEFYPPVGYQTVGKNKLFQNMVRKSRDEKAFEVIHVTGDGGSVAENSGLHLVKSCDVCGWNEWSLPKDGFHVDGSQWDGSDFVHVREFGPFFITEKAVEVLSHAGLSSFGAKLITEYRSPFA